MNDDDITYIGVENEETPEKNKFDKKKVKNKKPKFKVNRYNRSVNKFISSTKKKIISKELIIIILIILALIIFKPLTFLRNLLDEKREYYALMQQYSSEANGLNVEINLDNLWDRFVFATGKDYYLNCKDTMLMPVDGYVVCHYDFAHLGIDIMAKAYPGNVYAAASGTVCYVGNSEKYGNELTIQHYINGMTIYTFYGNLAQIYVSEGQNVTTSTIIGIEAGNSSSPAISVDGDAHHVHFAVRKTLNESSGLNPIIFAKYR